MNTLKTLHFENHFANLPPNFYSRLSPTPVPEPYLVSFNPDVARLIDLDPKQVKEGSFAEYFAGNLALPGSDPLAMLYAGHQFGQFVPQLGDGRAIMLGQVRNKLGQSWDLQLKGAGQTPYSRHGDGRAVLRSTIREYLCSEAMHGLGIPTTRALCIVGSDLPVYRETMETAAVLTRVAQSHVRFGSFEVFFYRDQHDCIKQLADYVITEHFPHLTEATNKYELFLREVISRTATMVADWQAVGFAHGVMNTDNMSILGLTFDYGPFGFIETYNPNFICNHSDENGRYAFNRQPQIALWNLYCLAEALTPIIAIDACKNELAAFEKIYATHYVTQMYRKLGFLQQHSDDFGLLERLLEILQRNQIDYTNFFRKLCAFDTRPERKNEALRDLFIDRDAFDGWAARYRSRLLLEAETDEARKSRMEQVNPKYILRNHLAQSAISKAENNRDFSEIDKLLRLLKHPYDEHIDMDDYANPPHPDASPIMVSCSS